MKKVILSISFILACSISIAQEKEVQLTPEQEKDILKQLKFDSTKLLSEIAANACECLDSVNRVKKPGANDHSKDILKCIDEQAGAYQIGLKVMRSLQSSTKNIEVSLDNNSVEYTKYYRDIERWLRDSCKSLGKLMSSSDKETKKSFSENHDAIVEYNKGIDLVREEKYADALPYFEKAVKIDPEFAFAWDNVGICYRRMGDYKKAVKAYKKSIEIDPEGQTPLQNLPVAYEFLKEYDEALEAYDNLTKRNPKNPEAFYGKGRVYLLYKKDMEQSLSSLCKAYNLYAEAKSPYRADAEKLINMIYVEMKKDNKEDVFNRILKENNISPNKKD